MSINEWVVYEANEEKVEKYIKKFNISRLSAYLLCSREMYSDKEFLNFIAGENFIENPFNFTDIDKAVLRIKKSIKNNEKICIYGDYDADGITASALVYKHLKNKNVNVISYIPERNKDGYGLNKVAIDFIKNQNVDLIFTVDNGITAVDEINYAKSLGIDIVITDHHRVHEKIPEAIAVVDPFREECKNLRCKNFAGVGVAFKFIEALEKDNLSYMELLEMYSEFVAIGTIGDSIKLLGESREIVKYGLNKIKNSSNLGIKALLMSCNLYNKELDAISIAFNLVPRINACGRMNNAELALKILLSENDSEAKKFCVQLNNLNELRKKIENQILTFAELLLSDEPWREYEEIIILEGKGWDHGVLGIVASRITAKYGKPCIMITIEGEFSRGSCRSIEGFSIYNILKLCSKYLTRFGGHNQAAGFTIKTSDIDKFKKCIESVIQETSVPNPTLNIDLKLEPSMICREILNEMDMFEPFGNGNPEPIFGFFNVKLKDIHPIGQNKHLRLTFGYHGGDFEALCFNKSADDFLYYKGETLDIAASLHKNEYKGISNISVYIKDLKISSLDTSSYLKHKKFYEYFKRNLIIPYENYNNMIPNYEDFVAVYRYLKSIKSHLIRVDLISFRVFKNNKSFLKVYIILDIFEELDLIKIYRNSDEYKIDINDVKEKVNLEDSTILKTILNKRSDSI